MAKNFRQEPLDTNDLSRINKEKIHHSEALDINSHDRRAFDLKSLGDEKIILNIKDFGEAYIPMSKLTDYALNREKAPDKACAFEEALGYNFKNIDMLIENIKRHVNDYELTEKAPNDYGRRFQQVMELIGENGKTAKVLLAWFLEKNTKEFRLMSIYVDKK